MGGISVYRIIAVSSLRPVLRTNTYVVVLMCPQSGGTTDSPSDTHNNLASANKVHLGGHNSLSEIQLS